MKVLATVAVSLLCVSAAIAESPRASMKEPAGTSPAAQAALDDIKATLGSVPSFFKSFPEENLPGAWAMMKSIQLSDKTAIPPKYKELIGLAVAAQIPCHYCTFFHSEAAKLKGANDRELKEAVALASFERHWSTFINGSQASDEETFKKQTDQMMAFIRAKSEGNAKSSPSAAKIEFASADEAIADIKETLGLVPEFVNKYPKEGLAGAWAEVKTLMINPNTAIPPKYKDLIMLSVAAQVPCPKCIYFDSESAKVDGATAEEINEAVAVASIVRHWSTFLNGMQTNEAQFKSEVSKVFASLRQKANKSAS